jgi:KDO2-lipid IV(A) lauroyltransferase
VISQAGILFMRMIAPLPLRWVRGLGWCLGAVLYLAVWPRRKVVHTNLRLCFPQWSRAERARVARQVFIHVAQSFLDRAWLWHGHPDVVRKRIKLTGAIDELAGTDPTILFAPHFVGLDAGATGISQQLGRNFIGIYTRQSNPVVDEWVLAGRHRFGNARPVNRSQGVRAILSTVRAGGVLYLLPDMNFGAEDSIFVPFYGVPAATVPSLSRFARLTRAKVVPVVTLMQPDGYEIRFHAAWAGFPTADIEADTALMNKRLSEFIDEAPSQYYWVHKRFKSRPPGEPGVY